MQFAPQLQLIFIVPTGRLMYLLGRLLRLRLILFVLS